MNVLGRLVLWPVAAAVAVVGFAFGAAFLAGGGLAVYHITNHVAAFAETRTWAPAVAHMEAVQLNVTRDGEGSTSTLTCRYTYEYDGRTYQGTRVGLGGESGSEVEHYHKLLKQAGDKPVTCYVDPANPRRAVLFRRFEWTTVLFWLPFATCFTLVGLFILRAWWQGLRAQFIASPKDLHPDEPWRWRADWVAGRVRAITQPNVTIAWLSGGASIGLGWPICLLFTIHVWRGEAPRILLVGLVLIPPVSLYLLVCALRATLRRYAHGGSELRLRRVPVGPGDTLEAELALTGRARLPAKIDIELQRIEEVHAAESMTERVHWRSQAVTVDTTGAGLQDMLVLPVRFDIPVDAPPSAPDNGLRWQVKVRGATDKPDADGLYFEVPVFGARQSLGAEDAK